MEVHARRYAYLSIGASLLTMALKFGAFFLTGSVGLFSDAVESVVNLTAGIIALMAIIAAHRPADQCHAYGHGKAEYFSSGMEGVLICLAASGYRLRFGPAFSESSAPRVPGSRHSRGCGGRSGKFRRGPGNAAGGQEPMTTSSWKPTPSTS